MVAGRVGGGQWQSIFAVHLIVGAGVVGWGDGDIKINYQYVDLCIPGVGERKFMEMGKILYWACNKTLPHEFDSVQHTFCCYRLLWDILVTALPAFCTYVKFLEPTWTMTRDVTTHSKRRILFFCFMSKSYHDYSSDTEQSLLCSVRSRVSRSASFMH